MSKDLVLMIGLALGLTPFFSSCGGDDEEELPSINIPLAFLSPMAQGDYTVRITITAANIPNAILSEQDLAIVEGSNRTYSITVDDIPVGVRRTVKVKVFKAGKLLFVGSGLVNISSGENQLALRLEKVAELLSSDPAAGSSMLGTGALTLNFSAPPGTVTVNGTRAVVQGNTASWTVPGLAAGATTLNIAWTAAGGGRDTIQLGIIGAVEQIAITPTSATLTAIGETVQLSIIAKDVKDQIVPDASVTWKSSNPSMASVSSEGLVTAQGNGTVHIIATSGSKSVLATITVELPDLIVLLPFAMPISVDAGMMFSLSVTIRNQGPGSAPLTTLRYYRSSDSSISTSDTEVDTENVSGLAASHTSDVSIHLMAPASGGTHYYGACVDTFNGESDTSNNCSQGVPVTIKTIDHEPALPGSIDDMVLIPAGDFQMGTNDGRSAEKPVHTVYLDAFYMDIYEVTNAQYKKFVDANPQWRKDHIPSRYHDGGYLRFWNGNSYPPGKGDHPVVYVSWYGAMAYAEWVGKRLPTEAEWEKAARGGLVGKTYPWGDLIDPSKANYGKNVGGTTPVGSYPPNGYGLYDMGGNVREWCLDGTSVGNVYKNSPRRNPVVGADSITYITNNFRSIKDIPTNLRIFRGGSWTIDPVYIALRAWLFPSDTSSYLGFPLCAGSVIP